MSWDTGRDAIDTAIASRRRNRMEYNWGKGGKGGGKGGKGTSDPHGGRGDKGTSKPGMADGY